MSTHVPTSTAEAVEARKADRSPSRHRMQRAARIFAGKPNFMDRVSQIPDKGWALLILTGAGLVCYALGCATLLIVESAIQ